MTTQYWLVKSEPDAYAWADLVRDGCTAWTGVRNYAARLHLNGMRSRDRVLFYESVTTKAVVGIAEVRKAAFPDPTADDPGSPASGAAKSGPGWVAVELKAVAPLAKPVTLDQIKADPALAGIGLVRQGRLSVMPLTADAYQRILKLGT
jgi:predicted RNA-binding protein with PUA-like domain